MRNLFFLLLAAILLFPSCDPDDDNGTNDDGTLSLTFKANYQGEPLVMLDKVYTYPDGTPVKFQLFNFYVSNVMLGKDGQSSRQLVSEVATIDYGEVYDVASAQAGISIGADNKLPAGQYDKIELGLGLSPALNATQPGDYAAGHPLTDNFWSWARGYVFAKIEANADLDGDGQFTDKLTYHMGDDELYQVLNFEQAINIPQGGTAEATIEVDLYKVLENSGEFIDISRTENTQDHTNDEALYGFLWDNLIGAFSLQ